MPVPKGGSGGAASSSIAKAARSDSNISFLSGGGAEAVFVFFVDLGGGRVAVACLDKKGKGLKFGRRQVF
jgi:hypothetical protein